MDAYTVRWLYMCALTFFLKAWCGLEGRTLYLSICRHHIKEGLSLAKILLFQSNSNLGIRVNIFPVIFAVLPLCQTCCHLFVSSCVYNYWVCSPGFVSSTGDSHTHGSDQQAKRSVINSANKQACIQSTQPAGNVLVTQGKLTFSYSHERSNWASDH